MDVNRVLIKLYDRHGYLAAMSLKAVPNVGDVIDVRHHKGDEIDEIRSYKVISRTFVTDNFDHMDRIESDLGAYYEREIVLEVTQFGVR